MQNVILFNSNVFCTVMVLVAWGLSGGHALPPIYKGVDDNKVRFPCGTGADCCGFCSNRNDCIYWLNCCDSKRNDIARQVFYLDCVGITDSINVTSRDYVVMVTQCPDGTKCTPGKYVAGKSFIYISESCAICNDDGQATPLNISSYMAAGVGWDATGDRVRIDHSSIVVVEQTNNVNVPIRHCNKHPIVENKYGLVCRKHTLSADLCKTFQYYVQLNFSTRYMYCISCNRDYYTYDCDVDTRSSNENAYSFILNVFDLAQLIDQRLEYNGQPASDLDCPKGHVLSHSKVLLCVLRKFDNTSYLISYFNSF